MKFTPSDQLVIAGCFTTITNHQYNNYVTKRKMRAKYFLITYT